ncbi:D-alanyl-D-alanine carboxypeptidase family protein [Desulfotruncus alcoholivorax]|uniref:D-alanyl-D-alanine carboxypeptidase family protein n=1 Tax=Desulfotruncus alcoholivorax TaxID=265477 RepID=UPI001EE5B550|nr:D-alanyl-D-alanine carboxypeptidase family protein [Desulfotruncus alcoholivorax]
MLLRYFRFLLAAVIFMATSCLNTLPAIAEDDLNINARAATLMDGETGQVYYTKDADKRMSPASLTKLMTAIVAVENGNLDDVVEITGRAASVSVGSTIGLHKGDKITLDNLLKAALVSSANDAAVAIAEHVGGSHDAFLYLMNRKAFLIGALDTQYANTNGYYDPKHYSTAYDLGLIARYALQKPRIRELVSIRKTVIKWEKPEKEKEIRNTNQLLFSEEIKGVNGVKTGSTARAGNCLIASATRGDKSFIAVVLHAGNRYREAAKLLEYGFKQVKPVVIFPAGKKLGEVAVRNGVANKVTVTVADPVKVNVAKDQLKNIKVRITLDQMPTAPIREGQLLGNAFFTINGYRLTKVPLVASKEVAPKPFLNRMLYWMSE